jgi:hypothetical protein
MDDDDRVVKKQAEDVFSKKKASRLPSLWLICPAAVAWWGGIKQIQNQTRRRGRVWKQIEPFALDMSCDGLTDNALTYWDSIIALMTENLCTNPSKSSEILVNPCKSKW